MLPATLSTPVDSRMMLMAGAASADAEMVRAELEGVFAGVLADEWGRGESPFHTFAGTAGMQEGAQTQDMESEKPQAGGAKDEEFVPGEGDVTGVVVGDVVDAKAQEDEDNAQDLPAGGEDESGGVIDVGATPAGNGEEDVEDEAAGEQVVAAVGLGSAIDAGVRLREAAGGRVERPERHEASGGHERDVPPTVAREPGRREGEEAKRERVVDPFRGDGSRDVARPGKPARVRPAVSVERPIDAGNQRVERGLREDAMREVDRGAPQHANREAPERGGSDLRERGERVAPASARAEQVDAALRWEQATGERVNVDAARGQANRAGGGTPLQTTADAAVRVTPLVETATVSTSSQSNPAQSSATTAAVDAARAEESPMTSRIVRGLTAMVNQRGGSLTMRLDPPDLGSMRVQMTIHQGTVVAQIVASTAQAHGLLEKNLAMLRSALESHGLTVERLTVQLSASPSQGTLNQQQQHQDSSGRSAQQEAHADAGEGQSRGRRDDGPSQESRHDADGEHERETFSRFMRGEAQPQGATSR